MPLKAGAQTPPTKYCCPSDVIVPSGFLRVKTTCPSGGLAGGTTATLMVSMKSWPVMQACTDGVSVVVVGKELPPPTVKVVVLFIAALNAASPA